MGDPAVERAVTLREILEPEPTPHIPDYVGKRLDDAYQDCPIISDPNAGISHHLRGALCQRREYEVGCRRAGFRAARGRTRFANTPGLQGVPDTFTFAGSYTDAYRMIGNGVLSPGGKVDRR